MGQSHLGKTKESVGVIPAMGVKLKIDTLERQFSKTKKLMYALRAEVMEPEDYEGLVLMEWFVIGTDQDPKASKEKTWKNAEGGPGRLKRLLVRSGTPLSDDDEEWCEAAEGQEVCAHVVVEKDRQSGEPRNRINGRYFRETDKDFVGVGESLAADAVEEQKGKGANSKSPHKAASKIDEDEDEEEKPKAKKVE